MFIQLFSQLKPKFDLITPIDFEKTNIIVIQNSKRIETYYFSVLILFDK